MTERSVAGTWPHPPASTTARDCGVGSDASSCASPCATSLGRADLPAVGRELAGLAEGCLGAALAIAAPTVPFAVIGMGKLGGSELNYASDVDVIFVHDGDGRRRPPRPPARPGRYWRP